MDKNLKRKKKFKKNNRQSLEEDPILKKKIKSNLSKKEINLDSKENETIPEGQDDIIPSQPLLTEYENFLRKYKIKKEDSLEKAYSSNVSKKNPNEIMQLSLPRINFIEKISYNSYERHFSENYKNFSAKILEDGVKEFSKDGKTFDFSKDFSFKNINQNHERKNRDEVEILNNNIKIRNFFMAKEFKREKTEYCSYYFEKLLLDKNAREFINKEGISQEPILHKKISHIPSQEEFDPEDFEIFSFLNEYIDYIYLGNDENEFLKVISIFFLKDYKSFLKFRKIWITHILNHFLNVQQKNKDELEAEENIKNKGFTRARVLILTPYKRDGFEVIN